MASQRLSFEDQTGLEEIQEEQQFPSRCHSESCLSEDDVVSGYSSLHEEPALFGSVQERGRTKQSLGENKRGTGHLVSLPLYCILCFSLFLL